MKRFLNSVLCMCIAVFCTHAQKKNVTSVLEVMDITTGQRSVVKEFPFLIEAPNWTPDGNWLVYNSGGKLYKLSLESPGEPRLINSDYATRCNNDHMISAATSTGPDRPSPFRYWIWGIGTLWTRPDGKRLSDATWTSWTPI